MAEVVVFDAVFFGHDRGLSGDAVSAGVLAGGLFALDGAGTGGFFGIAGFVLSSCLEITVPQNS